MASLSCKVKVRLFVKYKKTVKRKETNKEEKIPLKTTGDQRFEWEKEGKNDSNKEESLPLHKRRDGVIVAEKRILHFAALFSF